MDKRTTGVILGMVAGDAYINVRTRTRQMKPWHEPSSYMSSEIRVLHGMQQLAYCEYKCLLLNKLLSRNSTVTIVKNGPGGQYKAAQFSMSHPYFKLMKDWAYPNGVKTYNQLWLDHLTLESIALWYMDDGHARRQPESKVLNSVNIATCCSKSEVDLICDWFSGVYEIEFTPFPEKGNWSIRTNAAEGYKFVNLVRPYIIESMLYKVARAAELKFPRVPSPEKVMI